MLRRNRAPSDAVTVYLDGSPLPARRGESLAVALLGADEPLLARSPKLHRPRGPSCLRGGCDGCLARVDGVPNVMTCLHPVRGGERVEAQNVMGTRKADFLRVTDWFFPDGIDHHHLMAGVPGVSDVMQSLARKLAGLGRLPASVAAQKPATRAAFDVTVVGGGPSGVAVALRLARAGRAVCLVDDGVELGGTQLALADGRRRLRAEDRPANLRVLEGSTVGGSYLGELLVASRDEATVIRSRAKVFATGAHDTGVAAPNNDLPGVFSARALCRLLCEGIEPNGPVIVAGSGFWAEELTRRLGGRLALRVLLEDLVEVQGTGSVRGARVRDKGRVRSVDAVAIATAAPGAPAFEVAAQAGAAVRFLPDRGYAVVTDEHGRAGAGLWATGECTGADFEPSRLEEHAARVADDVLASG